METWQVTIPRAARRNAPAEFAAKAQGGGWWILPAALGGAVFWGLMLAPAAVAAWQGLGWLVDRWVF